MTKIHENPRNGSGTLLGVQNAHFIVGQLNLFQLWIIPAEHFMEGLRQRIHRPVAFGGGESNVSPYSDFDGRLGQ